MESKEIFRKNPDYYEVNKIKLDKLNPRLPPDEQDSSQSDLLVYMEKNFDLRPIARSMSDNGYFDEEPLIIIPDVDEDGKYIAIEGNRRLAALKFLTDPALRALSGNKKEYEELAATAVENLTQIPCIEYETREQTQAMLGFRHISGILKWSALSKARFVHDFIRSRTREEQEYSIIARILGDTTASIRRNYTTYRIYVQAQNLGIDVEYINKGFSIFYTAFGYLPIQHFIDIQIAGSTIEQFENPVNETYQDNLKELILWIHGDEDISPIITESRDLKYLAAAFDNSEALTYLKSGGRLLDAYSLTISEEKSVLESFNKASFNIEESLRFLHRHKTNEDVKKSVYRCSESLYTALQHFPDIRDEVFKKSSD